MLRAKSSRFKANIRNHSCYRLNYFRQPNNSLQRTTPAPHSVMPLAIGFKVLVQGKALSAIMALCWATSQPARLRSSQLLPVNSGVRAPREAWRFFQAESP